jgi:PAS domain S-box-containing protein
MTDVEPRPFPRAVADLAGRAWRVFRPPVSAPRFWIVQIAVLSIALVHATVLDKLDVQLPLGVPDSVPTGVLLLIPVVYAALNFGRRGAVATALWAAVLVLSGWLLNRHLGSGHLWMEAGYLAIITSVAAVVGQRVENEQQARRRTEAALLVARVAEARYRGLFEDQPAPVVITDAGGVVTEVNTAATRLFGPTALGRPLRELLSVGLAEVLTEQAPPGLSLRTLGGEERLFVPTAHALGTDGDRLVQIVLTDVTEQHRRREEQQAFAGRLLAVQEEGRRRLAHELHDDPLQSLMYLTRVLDSLSEHPELPARLTEEVLRDSAIATDVAAALRKVIRGLRPPILDDLGVVSALRQLTEEARNRSTLSIDLKVIGSQTRLSPELELTAYRVVQESLGNVIRHAHAHRVGIRVRFGEGIMLTVTDDGCGIQPSAMSGGDSGGGFGLIGMRERVHLAGGTLAVKPRRPHGTIVRASLPCRAPADEPYSSSVDHTGVPAAP